MDSEVDFNIITPCGGCCEKCKQKLNGDCVGCRNNDGNCVSMWSDGCDIYKCCTKHAVLFCGLCKEFPCKWIVSKIGEWDKTGMVNLKILADEYRKTKQ